MTTTVVGQANPTLLSQQASAIANATMTPVSSQGFVFYAGFNGTMNSNNPATSNDQVTSAVASLVQQIQDANPPGPNSNVFAKEYDGVGTPTTGGLAAAISPTAQATATAKQAYLDFQTQAAQWLDNNPGGDVSVMLSTFSRGSVAGAIFAQMVWENGVPNPIAGQPPLIPSGQVGFAPSLIISPVDTGATGNLTFPPGFQGTVIEVGA